jgi:hypothetical protein
VSLLLDEAFAEVDRTTGKALDNLKKKFTKQAETCRKSDPPSRPVQTLRPMTFFVVVPDAGTEEALAEVCNNFGAVGKVRDWGLAPAAQPKGGWVEVAVRVDSVAALREVVTVLGSVTIGDVFEVEPGHGKTLAKQLPLKKH